MVVISRMVLIFYVQYTFLIISQNTIITVDRRIALEMLVALNVEKRHIILRDRRNDYVIHSIL